MTAVTKLQKSSWVIISSLFILVIGLSALGAVSNTPASTVDIPKEAMWRGPDGGVLPFHGEDEVLDFLRTAEMISWQRLGEGINNSRKVLLEKDGVRMHAIFRSVKVYRDKMILSKATYFHFRDDAGFEVAAYKLARKLGLDNVPPTVDRKLFGTKGTLQLWIENATSEKKRIRRDLLPDDVKLWRLQIQTLRLFDNLISNMDRNQGNILFDSDWKLWMVDHTRAFRRHRNLMSPNTIKQVDKELWYALQALDDSWIRKELKDYLHPAELKALIQRKEALLDLVRGLVQQNGEELVFFEHSMLYSMQTGSLLPPRDS